jgi:N-acetyl-1-D-myo-inositol-2-amino-2-deoxy-alpha-D-glucopyranoside deacetylase
MEATTRLVGILRRHRPEVMVVYDPFGGYGHPDHIQAHRVGMAAFFGATDLARFPLADGEVPFRPAKLYWTVWPRSVARRYADLRKAAGTIDDVEYRSLQEAGTPDEDVNAWMEVSHLVDLIYQALKAHRSQFPLDGFLLGMPEEMRTELLGREAFIRVWSEVEVPRRETDLFSGLR